MQESKIDQKQTDTQRSTVKPFKKREVPLSESVKVDKFVEYLYQEASTKKPYLAQLIKDYIRLNGEYLLSISDTSGDYLTHHICTMLHDGDDNVLREVLQYLLNQSEDTVEEASYASFMKGIVSQDVSNKDNADHSDLNNKWSNGLIQTQQINIGNSLNQTPLHLLASHKKPRLLMTFLSVILDDQYSHINFNPNVSDSSDRTFMHVLLEKNLLQVYEKVSLLYGDRLNLDQSDKFQNHTIMVYKRLKNERLQKLKYEERYTEFVDELVTSDMRAYSDIKNLLFDRELGTNILSELATNHKQEKFLKLLRKIKETPQLMRDDIFTNLLNLPTKDGYNVVMKVIQQFNADQFERVLEMIGFEQFKGLENKQKEQNMLHLLFMNSHLKPMERSKIYKRLKLIEHQGFIYLEMGVDIYGNYPINYLMERISAYSKHSANNEIANEDIELFKEILDKTKVNATAYFDQNKMAIFNQHEKMWEIKSKLKNLRRQMLQAKKDKLKRREIFKQNLQIWKDYQQVCNQRVFENNPFDTAIKLNLQTLVQLYLSICKPEQIIHTDNLKLAAQLQNLPILQLLLNNLKPETQDYEFLKQDSTLLYFLKEYYEQYRKWVDGDKYALWCDQERYLQLYQELINKIVPEDSTNNSKQMKLFIDRNQNRVGLSDVILKWFEYIQKCVDKLKSSKLEHVQEISNVFYIVFMCNLQQNWPLLKSLRNFALSQVNEQLENKNLLYLKLFKQQAFRHNYDGILNLFEIFPKMKELFINTSDKSEQINQFLQKVAEKMWINYRDIVDPQTIEKLNEIGIVLLVPLNNVSTESKIENVKNKVNFKKKTIVSVKTGKEVLNQLDKRFLNLSDDQKQLLKKQMIQSCVNVLTQNKPLSDPDKLFDYPQELIENKLAFLAFMKARLQQKILFQIKPKLLSTAQKFIKIYIQYLFEEKDYESLKLLLDELYSYVQNQTCHYPINYASEIEQFHHNYPYRASKISSLIRKLNYETDVYPKYLGSYERLQITDDDEDALNKLYQDKFENESYQQGDSLKLVPNGLAFLYNMLHTLPEPYKESGQETSKYYKTQYGLAILHKKQGTNLNRQDLAFKIVINKANQYLIKEIIDRVIDLNGMPFVEIINLHDKNLQLDDSIKQDLMIKNKLLKNFNKQFKQGTLQSILHQMPQIPQLSQDFLSKFARSDHILSQSINSIDFWGKTPLIYAIEQKNWSFIETMLKNNKYYFLMYQVFNDQKVKQQTTDISANSGSQSFYNSLKVMNCEEVITLLKLLSNWLLKWLSTDQQKHYKDYILQTIQNRNKLLLKVQKQDKLSDDFDKEEQPVDEQDQNKESQQIQQQIRGYNIACYQNNYLLKQVKEQRIDNDKQLLSLFMDYTNGVFVQIIENYSATLTIDLLKEIESAGYDLSNKLTMAFGLDNEANPANFKKYMLPINFPYTHDYNNTYLLKWVLLNQPTNIQLIEHVFDQMDHQFYNKFALEITCYIGKHIGTNNRMFKKYFTDFKSYLCQRELTVESYILEPKDISKEKTYFEDMPLVMQQYYDVQSYENMNATLLEILLENGNDDLAQIMLDAQQRLYLTDSLMNKIQNVCLKNFRTNLLLRFGIDICYVIHDYAEIMENQNSKVTVKEIQEQRTFKRYIKAKQDDKNEHVLDILTEDQVELYFSSYLDKLNDRMDSYFKTYNNKISRNKEAYDGNEEYYANKTKKDKIIKTLIILFRKISPKLFERYIQYGIKNYSGDKQVFYQFFKMICCSLFNVQKSASENQMSKQHSMLRQRQVLQYLNNQAHKFAQCDKYYQIIVTDDTETSENIRQSLNIDTKQYQEFVEKIKLLREQYENVKDLKFEYKQLQNLMRGNAQPTNDQQQQTLPQRGGTLRKMMRGTSSIKEFQTMSTQQILAQSKQDLVQLSPNMIILNEYLHKVNNKATTQHHKPILSNKCLISDQELREQKETLESYNNCQSTYSNMYKSFILQENEGFYNEFEEIILSQKIVLLEPLLPDVISNLTLKKNEKLFQLLKGDYIMSYNYYSGKQLIISSLNMQIKLMEHIEKAKLEAIKQVPVDSEEYSSEIEGVDSHRQSIHDLIEKMLNVKAIPYQQSMAVKYMKVLLQPQMFPEYMNLYKSVDFNQIGRSFELGSMQMIKSQDIYNQLRPTFFEPLITKQLLICGIEGEVALTESTLVPFMNIIFTIFQYDDEELQKKILLIEKIMSFLPKAYEVSLFVMLSNKPQTPQYNYVNQLLKLMIPYVQDVVNISNQNLKEIANRYKINLPIREVNFRLQFVTSVNDPVSYLIKCGRFTSAKDYLAETGGQVTLSMLLHMIMFNGLEKDKAFLEWMLNNTPDDVQFARVKGLFSWLVINVKDIDQIRQIEKMLGNGIDLLQKEINYQDSFEERIRTEQPRHELGLEDEDEGNDQADPVNKYGILHNLMMQGYYKAVEIIVDLASEQQRKQLIEVRRVYLEDEATKHTSQICPYTLALINSQFHLCSKLLPNKDMLSSCIQDQDLYLIREFLEVKQINNISTSLKARQISQFLCKYEQDRKQSAKLQILKKLLIVPSLFKVFNEVPVFKFNKKDYEQQAAVDDEEQEEEEEAKDENDSMNKGEYNTQEVNMKYFIMRALSQCQGISFEIDVFLLNSGLDFSIDHIYSKYWNDSTKMLYLFEKVMNLDKIVKLDVNQDKITSGEYNIEFLCRPYSYLLKQGLIKDIKFDQEIYESIFQQPEIISWQEEIKEQIFQEHQSIIYNLFGQHFKERIELGLNPKFFAYNYFMMEGHRAFQILQDLEPETFIHHQCVVWHETLAQDLIYLDQTLKLFNPDNSNNQLVQSQSPSNAAFGLLKFDMYRKNFDYRWRSMFNEKIDIATMDDENKKLYKAITDRKYTVFRNKIGQQILNRYNGRELAQLMYILTLYDVKDLREPLPLPPTEPESESKKEKIQLELIEEFTFEKIIEYYLENAALLRQNQIYQLQVNDSQELEPLMYKLQLLNDALKELNQTCCSSTKNQPSLDVLAKKLNHKLTLKFDKLLFAQKLDIDTFMTTKLPLEHVNLYDSYKLKFEISKSIYQQLYQQLDDPTDKLQQTIAKLDFYTVHLNNLVDFMRQYVTGISGNCSQKGKSKMEVILDFDIVLTGKSEVKKVTDYTFNVVINKQDLVDDICRLEPIGKELKSMIIRERIKQYINAQVKAFKKKDSTLAQVNVQLSDDYLAVINQYSYEELCEIELILSQKHYNQRKHTQKDITIHDIINTKMLQYQTQEQIDSISFECLTFKLLTLDDLQKDLQNNLPKYVREAFELTTMFGYVDVIFAFDVKKGEIVLQDMAYLPLARGIIESINNQIAAQINLSTQFNKSKKLGNKAPVKVIVESQTFFDSVMKNFKIKNNKEDPIKIATDFLEDPLTIQTIQNATSVFQEQFANTVNSKIRFKLDDKQIAQNQQQLKHRINIVNIDYNIDEKPQEDSDPSSDYMLRSDIDSIITIIVAFSQ